MTIPADLVEDVVAEAYVVLRERQHEIANDLLDGMLWPGAVYGQALDNVRKYNRAG